jgi:putative flippase GtrA
MMSSKPLLPQGSQTVRETRLQFLKFLMGGVANTAVTYAMFVALSLAVPAAVAYTASYVAGIGISYLINTFFVFQARASLRSAMQYPAVYLIQYLLGLGLLSLLTSTGLDSRLAMLVVIAFNVPATFVLAKLVIK